MQPRTGKLQLKIISISRHYLVKKVEMEAVLHPIHTLGAEVIVWWLEGQLQLLIPSWIWS